MNRKQVGHEDFGRERHPEIGSERGFGIVFCVVFTIVGVVTLVSDHFAPQWWPFAMAAVFGLAAWLAPRGLASMNRLWFWVGIGLGMLVAPLVMGLVFFLVVTPIALIRRLAGKDSLNTRFDPEADSYWVRREPPGPDPRDMERQF